MQQQHRLPQGRSFGGAAGLQSPTISGRSQSKGDRFIKSTMAGDSSGTGHTLKADGGIMSAKELLEWHCTLRKMDAPVFTHEQQAPNQFMAVVMIGRDEIGRSDRTYSNITAAESAAASHALSYFEVDAPSDSGGENGLEELDEEELLERLFTIVNEKRFQAGITDQKLSEEYVLRHKHTPPDGWLSVVKDSAEFEVSDYHLPDGSVIVYAKQKQLPAARGMNSAARAVTKSSASGGVRQKVNFHGSTDNDYGAVTSVRDLTMNDQEADTTLLDRRSEFYSQCSPQQMAEMMRAPTPLHKGGQKQVRVVSAISPLCFAVRLVEDEPKLARLESDMAENYDNRADSCTNNDILNRPLTMREDMNQAGGLFAAYNSGHWHRVIVIDTARLTAVNIRPRGSIEEVFSYFRGDVTVQYMDTGGTGLVSVENLRILSPDLIEDYPQFAVFCGLSDFPNGGVTDRVTNRFRSLVLTGSPTFWIELIENSGNMNMIIMRQLKEGASIVQMLLEDKSIRAPMVPTPSGPSGDHNLIDVAAVSPILASSFGSKTTRLTPGVVTNGNGQVSKRAMGKPMSNPSSIRIRPALTPARVGGASERAFDAIIVGASDPGNITVHLASVHPIAEYLETLLAREAERMPPLLEDSVKQGDDQERRLRGEFAAARIRVDNNREAWRRVVFCGVRAERHVKVFLVDYGTFDVVNTDALRQMPEAAFVVQEMMAIKCQLGDVRPCGGRVDWLLEEKTRFEQRMMSGAYQHCRVEMLPGEDSVGAWQRQESPSLPLVLCRVMSPSTGEYISRWLINNRLAIGVQ